MYAGDRYDGEFKDGREDGIGIFTWRDGSTFHGFWCHGKKDGIGVGFLCWHTSFSTLTCLPEFIWHVYVVSGSMHTLLSWLALSLQ